MRSRIAITALLATGALMSSGGAALGVSALSTTTDASQAQYGPVQGVAPTQNAAPTTLAPSGNTVTAATPAASGRKGATDETKAPATAKAQPARQLEASDSDKLPFTGYAAIPLLLLGLGLLVSGLVLRRSTRGPQQVT